MSTQQYVHSICLCTAIVVYKYIQASAYTAHTVWLKTSSSLFCSPPLPSASSSLNRHLASNRVFSTKSVCCSRSARSFIEIVLYNQLGKSKIGWNKCLLRVCCVEGSVEKTKRLLNMCTRLYHNTVQHISQHNTTHATSDYLCCVRTRPFPLSYWGTFLPAMSCHCKIINYLILNLFTWMSRLITALTTKLFVSPSNSLSNRLFFFFLGGRWTLIGCFNA